MHLTTVAASIALLGLIAACAPAPTPAAPAVAASTTTATGSVASLVASPAMPYEIVDTEQSRCYDMSSEVSCGSTSFRGQDAPYAGNQPRYRDNRDGTVTDVNTGLMWQADPGAKVTYAEALDRASSLQLAGYDDWRLASIKELYSLILFDGTDASSCQGPCSLTPFIDTRYFHFSYGDEEAGERIIDSQFVSSTKYVSTTMNRADTVFGVNFADGRIKGYPTGAMPGQSSGKEFYALYVRGNPDYGKNVFVDRGDGSVTDQATGLTWMKADSGAGMDWGQALAYCEDSNAAENDDWRLPNAKELQSIVDYTRSPDTTGSAAIDPVFHATAITNEAGQTDFPFYWTSTTHGNSAGSGDFADYVSFGRAMGYMGNGWIDVHGAGAQRSDPKTGDAAAYPQGHGPQGDAVRIQNFVRCVRGGAAAAEPSGGRQVGRPAISVQSQGINQGSAGNTPPRHGNSQPAGRTPPQAAVQACAGSTSGASCTFASPRGTVDGMCEPVQHQLACVPLSGP